MISVVGDLQLLLCVRACIGHLSRCALGGHAGFEMVRSLEKDTWRAEPTTGAVKRLRGFDEIDRVRGRVFLCGGGGIESWTFLSSRVVCHSDIGPTVLTN